MLSEFLRSPELLKGALGVFASQKPSPLSTVIVFQYNAERLSGSLAYRAAQAETIPLSLMWDAVDQLEQPEQNLKAAAMVSIWPWAVVRREYAKIDKLLTEVEFGSHLRVMKT